MIAFLDIDATDASILSLLIVMTWAVISFFCGRYGREKGYSFCSVSCCACWGSSSVCWRCSCCRISHASRRTPQDAPAARSWRSPP